MEIQLSPQQEALLERLSIQTSRSKVQIVKEAIESYLDHERWFAEAVAEGKAAQERGELVDHEDVVESIEQRFRA